MISRGLIIFLRRSERSELIRSDFCTCYFCSLIRRFVGMYLEATSQLICFFLNLCHRGYSVRKKLIQISSFRATDHAPGHSKILKQNKARTTVIANKHRIQNVQKWSDTKRWFSNLFENFRNYKHKPHNLKWPYMQMSENLEDMLL